MATNKVQCPNGHFYNADKYDKCPVCNKGTLSAPGSQASAPPMRTLPEKVTTASRTQFEETPAISSAPIGAYGPSIDKTVSIMDNLPQLQPEPQPIQPAPIFVPEQIPEAVLQPEPQFIQPEPVFVPEQVPEAVLQPEPQPIQPEPSPLQTAVNAVVSHSDAEDVKTVAMWNAPAGTEPVVGWLVCVKGEYFGQSFGLKTGNNAVGRAMNMDVPLAQEPSVSRNKHCIITFEPQHQVFYIQQGESSGLTYLNGEMVLLPTKMQEQDRIKLGAVEFLLIPFCADGFRWEEYTV